MTLYNKSEWKAFRDEIIELDGFKCKDCGRAGDETILQVHHKTYIKGRKPWEYPTKDCETLCKACHASRHSIIRPQIGWEFISQEDLGDLSGTCQNCGATIRHSFLIQHENWGAMEVGTFCCDKLTDSNVASNLIESQTSYLSRKQRFISSKRWKFDKGIYIIKQSSFGVEIKPVENSFLIKIHGKQSESRYETLTDAQSKVFDVIESGEFIEYLKRHNIPFNTSTSKTSKRAKQQL